MGEALSVRDVARLKEELTPAIRAVVAALALIEDPAELELEAGGILPPVPSDVAGVLLDELLEIVAQEPAGPRVLAAASRSGAPALAGRAGALARRLGEPEPPALAIEGAWLLDARDEDVSSLLVRLRREDTGAAQLFGFTFERAVTDGALKTAFGGPALEGAEIEETIARAAREFGITPAELDAREAVGMVVEGAVEAIEAGLGPPGEDYAAVAVFLRAFGVPDAEEILERMIDLPPLAEALDEEDDGLEREASLLAAEFAGWYRARSGDPDLVGLAGHVAREMADFRVRQGYRDLTAWDARQLEVFLLSHVPAHSTFAGDELGRVPGLVAEVFGFLGDSERLEGRRAGALARRALALQEQFERTAGDPRRFGIGKGIALAMAEDDVDLQDPDAVRAWIEAFNALPEGERERRVPALEALPRPSKPARDHKPGAKGRAAGKRRRR